MTFELMPGDGPLVVSCPHVGTMIPDAIAARMTPAALAVADTDWFVDRLYAFVASLGGSLIRARYSRYVVDLNRAPDGHALYPGRRETGLVPTISFADEPLYRAGEEPDAAEIVSRVDACWRPYHEALAAEIERKRAAFGQVLLWDAHSILSEVPMFFEGRLPDFNLGTAGGTSAGADIEAALVAALGKQSEFSWVANGRFKGGYITRHHGRPGNGVHAVQMEMAQACYMDEQPPTWNADKAARASRVLAAVMAEALRVMDAAP